MVHFFRAAAKRLPAMTSMNTLITLLRGMPPLALAFSGGLDSRFLAHAAGLAGCDVLLLHASGPHISPPESAQARIWAKRRRLRLRPVSFDPLLLPAVAANSRARCYHCKKALLALLHGQAENRTLCDGTQADDLLHPHRPGSAAVRESGVRSPLAEAGLDKARIRGLARASGLDDPEQAARPCLLTRLPYGMRPQTALLARLAAAESELQGLGLTEFRLRLTPKPQLHLLRMPETQEERIPPLLARYGFMDAEIVLLDTLSGFFDI